MSSLLSTSPPVPKREERDCKSCEERRVSTATVPERIGPMSLLIDRLVAGVVVAKYADNGVLTCCRQLARRL